MNGDVKEPRERLLVLARIKLPCQRNRFQTGQLFPAVSSGLDLGFMTRAFWNTVLGYLLQLFTLNNSRHTPYSVLKAKLASKTCSENWKPWTNISNGIILGAKGLSVSMPECYSRHLDKKARLFFKYSSSAAPELLCHISAPTYSQIYQMKKSNRLNQNRNRHWYLITRETHTDIKMLNVLRFYRTERVWSYIT